MRPWMLGVDQIQDMNRRNSSSFRSQPVDAQAYFNEAIVFRLNNFFFRKIPFRPDQNKTILVCNGGILKMVWIFGVYMRDEFLCGVKRADFFEWHHIIQLR